MSIVRNDLTAKNQMFSSININFPFTNTPKAVLYEPPLVFKKNAIG